MGYKNTKWYIHLKSSLVVAYNKTYPNTRHINLKIYAYTGTHTVFMAVLLIIAQIGSNQDVLWQTGSWQNWAYLDNGVSFWQQQRNELCSHKYMKKP